ncbi:MAG: hypothetical protein M3R38_00730 [Actinomycetota bacterium]|nr:hypothetical protein [Actinomycetota bacterium]
MSGIFPGALGRLQSLDALAEAGEWTALAALAHVAHHPPALGALAASANKEAAFRWAWPIVRQATDARAWVEFNERLAEGVRVPENRRQDVRDFVLSPLPTGHPQVPENDPRRVAQQRLLERLDPRAAFARDLARAVIEADAERLWPGMRLAAFGVLGASRRKGDRSVLLEATEGLPAAQRLRPLASLSAPYSEAEQDKVVEVLRAALPLGAPVVYGGSPTPYDPRPWARRLAAGLPADRLEELLGEPWAGTDASREGLFGEDFFRQLGLDKLQSLLASDLLDEQVRRHMVRAASGQLPLEELATLGRWTHRNLDPAWSVPLRDRLWDHARKPGYGTRSPAGEEALAALRDFALACDDAGAARAFAGAVEPGEAPRMLRDAAYAQAPPRRAGRIAGEMLATSAGTSEEDVLRMTELYPEDGDRADFLSGLAAAAGEVEDERLDLGFLGPAVLGRPRSIAVLAEAGHGLAVARVAASADDPVQACLLVAEAAAEHLDPDALEIVEEWCHWSRLDLLEYRRYVAALQREPFLLELELRAALGSLAGPEADVIEYEKLEVPLRAALDHDGSGTGELVEDDPLEHLKRLLATPSRGLQALAREWAARLDPDEDVVRMVVRASESSFGAEEDFARVRRSLAAKLVEKASDPGKGWKERGDDLELAREAAPEAAREAAVALCASGPAGFRRRAARVLADTNPRAEDEEALEGLLVKEVDAEARRYLLAARRNLSSGSLAEAVENLSGLAGLERDRGPDPDVLLPDESWHEAFVAGVDKARGRSGGEPGAYIDALITLSELLVEQAVIARFDVAPGNGSAKEKEVEALRNNRPGKPDVGALLGRQQAQKVFPWFPEVIVLRRLRGAHPAPSGTTRPLLPTDRHVAEAEGLFSAMVQGWQASMAESRTGRESGSRADPS